MNNFYYSISNRGSLLNFDGDTDTLRNSHKAMSFKYCFGIAEQVEDITAISYRLPMTGNLEFWSENVKIEYVLVHPILLKYSSSTDKRPMYLSSTSITLLLSLAFCPRNKLQWNQHRSVSWIWLHPTSKFLGVTTWDLRSFL